jgi:hypothetical protein
MPIQSSNCLGVEALRQEKRQVVGPMDGPIHSYNETPSQGTNTIINLCGSLNLCRPGLSDRKAANRQNLD